MIKLVIGLSLAMITNTFLGTTLAKFKKQFKKENLIKGIYKYATLILGLALLYLCGNLNPDILIDFIPELEINITETLAYTTKAGIIYYSVQAFLKLAKVLNINSSLKKEEGN